MRTRLLVLAALPLLAATAAFAGPVTVTFEKPETYTDVKVSYYANDRERDGILTQLREHLERAAPKRLPAGTTLDIKVTDVDMAGGFEMPMGPPALWRVRLVKDIYPPRMDLSFRLSDGEGRTLREGTRKLVDAGFLVGASPHDTDFLRFEKAMLDGWLDREFPRTAANANR